MQKTTELKSIRQHIAELVLKNQDAVELQNLHAQKIEEFLIAFAKQISKNLGIHFSLIAVGGFGRRELALHSDIDILILHDGQNPEITAEFLQNLLTPLWDAGLEVGHALRTPKECLEDAKNDHVILTNLLDRRFLCGHQNLFDDLDHQLTATLKDPKTLQRFVESKQNEYHTRHEKFGDSVYVLQPNIKEGKGGLRDVHFVRWLAMIHGHGTDFNNWVNLNLIQPEDADRLKLAYRFFLQTRNHLHALRKRKSDQLVFDVQEPLAIALGFCNDPDKNQIDFKSDPTADAEHFMQTYYTFADQVRLITQSLERTILRKNSPTKTQITSTQIFEKTPEGWLATNPQIFDSELIQIMNLFDLVSESGLGIHPETRDELRSRATNLDDRFRTSPELALIFRRIMSRVQTLGDTLFAMHDVRIFDSYIPEFRKLRNKVQRDIYHLYTVDTHSIFAVSDLSKLARGEYQKEFSIYESAYQNVKNKGVLAMGLLFHDVGKGEDGNHSVVGAEMARRVGLRLGYDPEDIATMEFLVLSHLMMPHLSQRRDLEEPVLIQNFAKTMKNEDRLNMLYVLTWADIRAVSPEAWTEWKGTLLTKLYQKTLSVLKNESPPEEQATRRIPILRREILERMREHKNDALLENFLTTVSARYLVAHDDQQIISHFELIEKHANESFVFDVMPSRDAGASEIFILTYDNPRVLSLVTGVMLAFGINILDLEVFTLLQGSIFIKLRVITESGGLIAENTLGQNIGQSLKNVFTGKVIVNDLIAKRKKPSYLVTKKPLKKTEIRIDIDNDVSPYFTIIDVFAHDRLGLLFDIIRCLTENGCYVELSKISTKVEQVVDTFYVKDIFGHKITSKGKLSEIKSAIQKVLESF